MNDAMTETEIRAKVEAFIASNNLDAKIVECEREDGWWSVTTEVGRADYDRIFSLEDAWFSDFSVRWRQRTPELVSAEVGDLVLIYSEHDGNDEDSDVGLVYSKFTNENGEVYYGCRYIQIGLDNQFINRLYDFAISKEDYGGYPTGFLKVLTKEETIAHLRRQLEVALKKEQEATKTKFERCNKVLKELITALGEGKRVQCEKLELEELPTSVQG